MIFAYVNIYRGFTVCWALSRDLYSSLLHPCKHQTVHRTVPIPLGDEPVDTGRFSVTQAWKGWQRLQVAGVRGGGERSVPGQPRYSSQGEL